MGLKWLRKICNITLRCYLCALPYALVTHARLSSGEKHPVRQVRLWPDHFFQRGVAALTSLALAGPFFPAQQASAGIACKYRLTAALNKQTLDIAYADLVPWSLGMRLMLTD